MIAFLIKSDYAKKKLNIMPNTKNVKLVKNRFDYQNLNPINGFTE